MTSDDLVAFFTDPVTNTGPVPTTLLSLPVWVPLDPQSGRRVFTSAATFADTEDPEHLIVVDRANQDPVRGAERTLLVALDPVVANSLCVDGITHEPTTFAEALQFSRTHGLAAALIAVNHSVLIGAHDVRDHADRVLAPRPPHHFVGTRRPDISRDEAEKIGAIVRRNADIIKRAAVMEVADHADPEDTMFLCMVELHPWVDGRSPSTTGVLSTLCHRLRQIRVPFAVNVTDRGLDLFAAFEAFPNNRLAASIAPPGISMN